MQYQLCSIWEHQRVIRGLPEPECHAYRGYDGNQQPCRHSN